MKKIPGFPNYSITKDGRVWSQYGRGKWLNPVIDRDGYLYVFLCGNGRKCRRSVHRLVLETFVGLRPPGLVTRHLDGNPANNTLNNVCWGTNGENTQDSIRHGTHHASSRRGEKHPNSKLSDQDRRLIFSVYYDGAYTIRELAGHFDVSRTVVGDITRGNRWGQICLT